MSYLRYNSPSDQEVTYDRDFTNALNRQRENINYLNRINCNPNFQNSISNYNKFIESKNISYQQCNLHSNPTEREQCKRTQHAELRSTCNNAYTRLRDEILNSSCSSCTR